MRLLPTLTVSLVLFVVAPGFAQGQDAMPTAVPPPDHDARQAAPRDLDTPMPPPVFGSKAAWLRRRADLREQILTAAGLQPMPPRPPILPHYGTRVDHDNYSVQPVWFETRPGLVLGGNVYRPRGITSPKWPAVLSPHGHMERGRLADDELFSVPGRGISFARQGYVAFCYDMLGYNDTGLGLPHRQFGIGSPVPALWGLSVFGLQTWNSLRAMDFLCALPDVDAQRIGVTGESGGGTQTFILCAIDDRFAAAAPVNMISLHMQGGCLCENAPGLRLDTNNVEIGAMAAPKPMLMVSATGDWTKDTPRLEGPAAREAWDRLGAADRLEWVQFNYGHNYNRDSREAVYAWFGRWLLDDPNPRHFTEHPYKPDADAALLAFPDHKPPAQQWSEAKLTARILADDQAQWQALLSDREAFARAYEPALRHCLGVEPVAPTSVLVGGTSEAPVLGREGRGDRVETHLTRGGKTLTILLGTPDAATQDALTASGRSVLTVTPFRFEHPRDAKASFYTGYNRTQLANRVQDAITAAAFGQRRHYERIELVGVGDGGPVALLAAPFSGAKVVAADLGGLDCSKDGGFVGELWQPGLRRAGDFRTAALLVRPGRVLVHHVGGGFDAVARTEPGCHVVAEAVDAQRLAEWLDE